MKKRDAKNFFRSSTLVANQIDSLIEAAVSMRDDLILMKTHSNKLGRLKAEDEMDITNKKVKAKVCNVLAKLFGYVSRDEYKGRDEFTRYMNHFEAIDIFRIMPLIS